MSTPRLYYDDAFLFGFQATVVAHAEFDGKPSVLLDQTAFYPESGGQMADLGVLGTHPVVDVQQDNDGRVHHLLKGTRPPVDASITGTIDRQRRQTHMALHTGQHILSKALFEETGADTVSSRLGENECTIDLNQASIPESALYRAEELANAIVDDDLAIRAYFPSPEELPTIQMRNAPKVTDDIRVVSIGDFDHTPCGGTHCAQTSQVGSIHISQIEKNRGQVRVQFTAGRRGRDYLFSRAKHLAHLSSKMSCGPFEIENAINKLRLDLKDSREQAGTIRALLADFLSSQLASTANDRGQIIHVLPDGDPTFLRHVSKKLVDHGFCVFLAGQQQGRLRAVVACPEGNSLHCGHFFRQLVTLADGKGGGQAHFAQGHFPIDQPWQALVEEALSSNGAGNGSACGD